MPPGLGNKGKGKVKDSRQSRSRNTTPSSVVSAPLSASLGINIEGTAYLEIGIGSLVVPTNVLYDDILERHGAGPGIPDTKHLEAITGDLRTLYQLAAKRETACDTGMRELSGRRKMRIEEDRELEQQHREASLKRAAEDDEMERPPKGQKLQNQKKKARPLNRGAHEVARQDGLDVQSICMWQFSIQLFCRDANHAREQRADPLLISPNLQQAQGVLRHFRPLLRHNLLP